MGIRNYSVFMFIVLFLNISVSVFSQVKMNEFEHKQPLDEYIFEPLEVQKFMKDNYVKLDEYLPKDFVKDASIDYTVMIQSVLDQHRNVKFPGVPLLINEKGLTINSNSNLYFSEKSKLILKPNKEERYEVIRIHNVSNITLINPVIIGDKNLHKDTKGEWGMGISIRGASKNIEVYNANISDTWGDGIYLGHLRKIAPENIKIVNATINNAYRNGISITTGRNIEVKNTLISNSNFNGVKIEPSNSEAIFENLVFNNINTFNNYSSGFAVGGYSKLIGNSETKLELKIMNPRDCGSTDGMFFGMVSVREKSIHPVKGYIKIINPEWLGNAESTFTKRKFYGNIPKIEFIDITKKYEEEILLRHKKDRDFIKSAFQR